jgi:hypothetical protein
MTGGVFIGLGLLFIVAHKLENKRSIIPMTLHSMIGILPLLAIIAQVVSGNDKLTHMASGGQRKVRRWHGDMGLLTWDLLCATLLLGLQSFLAASFSNLLVMLVVVVCWFAVHAQVLSNAALLKHEATSSDHDLSSRDWDRDRAGGDSIGRERVDSFGALDLEISRAMGGGSGGAGDDSEFADEDSGLIRGGAHSNNNHNNDHSG